MVCPQIAPYYHDRDWRLVPPGDPLDLDALDIHYGYAWYRARLPKRISGFKLDARHCFTVWLNGVLVRAVNNHGNLLGTGDDMAERVEVRFPAELYRAGENVVTVLVESLGHNKGFLEDSHNRRGIVSLDRKGQRWNWRVRGGLLPGESGITPRVDFSALPLSQEEEVELPHQWPSDRHGVGLYQTTFALERETPDDPPLGLYMFTALEKANIYLNGWLIGRYWESLGPQKVFYLPSGLLNLKGENHLALTLWRWQEPARLSKLHLTMYP
jgi:beta-galactosidase